MIITLVIIAVTLLGIILYLLSTIIHIRKIQEELEVLNKEQHIQNTDIIKLLVSNNEHKEMLLKHIEILKYLVEQDYKLNSGKMYWKNIVGEA